MHLWWLKDKVAQQNFDFFWDMGVYNWAVLTTRLSLSAGKGVLVP